jgi:Alpha amylase, catalytic domain
MDARTKKAKAAHLWYKDAIIYQLHVKSFFDSNNDGIGDILGLISQLDYIADLGVNAIWLLPFYPSPRLDDGYDISGYRDVHPDMERSPISVSSSARRMPAIYASSPILRSTTPPTNTLGFSEPGTQSRDRRVATSMFGSTTTKSTLARASSSSIRNAPIGRGMQVLAPTTGIASPRTNPI